MGYMQLIVYRLILPRLIIAPLLASSLASPNGNDRKKIARAPVKYQCFYQRAMHRDGATDVTSYKVINARR